jgi:MFS family permease
MSTSRDAIRVAWLVVALLWPVALLNYLDRQMLAAMKFSVMHDIPTIGSEANWGFLPAVFKWVYAALSPVGGLIADRFNKRYVVAGSLFVWSAVTWATGHADTFDHLLVTRALMGISEAFYIPAALALIADHHSLKTRSRAVGVHQMGIYCGVIIGGFSGYAADAPWLGWRMAFSICGVLGVIYAVPLLFLLREAPRSLAMRKSAPAPADSLRALFTSIPFLLLVACFTLPALSAWIVRDWMPAILKQQFSIGQGKAGVSATLYVQIGSIAGVILGGWLADRLAQRTVRGRIFVSALGISLLIPALFGVGNAATLAIAVAFLTLFGLGWGFFDCNNMPILSQIAPPHLRATGYGIMNMVSISCGGFADWTFGALRDRQVPINIIFAVYAAIAFVSVFLMLLIRPRELPRADAPIL